MSPSPDAVEAVSQRLNIFLSAQRASALDLGPEAGLLVEAGATAVGGGKRLRGRFCVAGWRAVQEASRPAPSMLAEVVTAAAEVVHASATAQPDLFWALRGGGGNFGVVTRFEFRLHPVGPDLLSGLVVYPLAEAKSVLRPVGRGHGLGGPLTATPQF